MARKEKGGPTIRRNRDKKGETHSRRVQVIKRLVQGEKSSVNTSTGKILGDNEGTKTISSEYPELEVCLTQDRGRNEDYHQNLFDPRSLAEMDPDQSRR